MSIYDVEMFLDDVAQHMKDKLPAKLESISNEKADGLVLDPIVDEAIFLQTMDSEIANYDPFIVYGIDDVNLVSVGPVSSKEYRISILVVKSDNGLDTNITKRMLRYLRALEEIFQESFADIGNTVKLKLNSYPIEFRRLNETNQYRVTGVSLDIELVS